MVEWQCKNEASIHRTAKHFSIEGRGVIARENVYYLYQVTFHSPQLNGACSSSLHSPSNPYQLTWVFLTLRECDTLVNEMLLMMCGNIESNPGPSECFIALLSCDSTMQAYHLHILVEVQLQLKHTQVLALFAYTSMYSIS